MIQFKDISPRFRELLYRAGWSPERQVEITGWVTSLQKEGFTPNPIALAILASFGGLSLRIPPAGTGTYEHELRFDPVRAATGESDRGKEWKDELGVDLFPVGEEVTSGNIIWAGSDGRIYYGRGFGLYLLGDSLQMATEWLALPVSAPILCAE
jgi:hypothetical protein